MSPSRGPCANYLCVWPKVATSSTTIGTKASKRDVLQTAGKLREALGTLAKHFLRQNSRLSPPRLSGGLGVGSSNVRPIKSRT